MSELLLSGFSTHFSADIFEDFLTGFSTALAEDLSTGS